MKFNKIFKKNNTDNKANTKNFEGKYFTPNEIYKPLYNPAPTVFNTNKKYRSMSSDAKWMYTYFEGINALSIKNHWVDDNGVYFICTNERLDNELGFKKDKAIRVKKELETYGLLRQIRQGCKKPNKLYLLHPDLSAEDVYIPANKKELLEEQDADFTVAYKFENQAPETEPVNTESSEEEVQVSQKVEKSPEEANKQAKPQNYKQATNYFNLFSRENVTLIDMVVRNSNIDSDEIQKLILKSKGKAVYDNGFKIGSVFDVKDFQYFIKTTLHGVIKNMKTKSGIKNLKGYIYKSFYQGFSKFARIYNHYVDSADFGGFNNFAEDQAVNPLEDILMDHYRSDRELNLQI